MTINLILAADVRQAHSTADIDWKWRRVANNRYRMPNGEDATIVTTGDHLRGTAKADVYLAYGWQNLSDRDMQLFEALVGMGRLTIKDPVIGGNPT